MGFSRHKCIVVTGYTEAVNELRDDIVRAYRANYPNLLLNEHTTPVSEVILSPYNGLRSFFIAPDGGKEWGIGSEEGDRAFAQVKIMVRKNEWVDFVELQIGGDDGKAAILDTDFSTSDVRHYETR